MTTTSTLPPIPVPGWNLADVEDNVDTVAYQRTNYTGGRRAFRGYHGQPVEVWWLPSVVGENEAVEFARAFHRAHGGKLLPRGHRPGAATTGIRFTP